MRIIKGKLVFGAAFTAFHGRLAAWRRSFCPIESAWHLDFMNRVYSVAADQSTAAFVPIHCINEERELQNLLEKNLNLIPGDQVSPENPRRWLLVKKEMDVEDPGTGEGRWSLDFLLIDQDGVPTLVECKRFKDTRSRREVIGQMFDYAANASFYLSRDTLVKYLEAQAQKRGVHIDELVRGLESPAGASVDGLLDLVENNITQGQLRLVFFMEQASAELRSIVAFLNSQMERTEVCLVEAKQFELNGARVVVPTLFGYTEQARRVKRTVTLQKSGGRRAWTLEMFREDVAKRLDRKAAAAVLSFHDFCKGLTGVEVRWGNGKDRGSFSVVDPRITHRSVFTVLSDGELWLNFNWLGETEDEHRIKTVLFQQLSAIPQLALTDGDTFKGRVFPAAKWLPSCDQVQRAVASAIGST
jgi:hypothetical protein